MKQRKSTALTRVVDKLCKVTDTNLKGSEWGVLGKYVKKWGEELFLDAVDKFRDSPKPLEEKKKIQVPYLIGIAKGMIVAGEDRSGVVSKQDSSLVDDILDSGKEI